MNIIYLLALGFLITDPMLLAQDSQSAGTTAPVEMSHPVEMSRPVEEARGLFPGQKAPLFIAQDLDNLQLIYNTGASVVAVSPQKPEYLTRTYLK